MMKKGWYWPWLIGGMLLATAVSQGWMYWTATHDASMAIEPDYYNKGVAYDSVVAQRDASARLGWKITLTTGSLADHASDVGIMLSDSAGAPITGAHVTVAAINNVVGARHVESALSERGEGRYGAVLTLDRPGLWEFQIEVVRGRDRFAADLRADISVAATPAAPAR